MTPLQYTILRLLADGSFHSGEDLARTVGVSRSAIWKALQGVRSLGLAVHAVSGRGYRLPAVLELLDRDAILAVVDQQTEHMLQSFEVLRTVDSTNAWLMRLDSNYAVAACVAEHQTSGRGRRGRQWFSPFGSNLYLSLRYRFDEGMGRLAGLSLAVAVAVLRALRDLGVEQVALKWPNDVYWQGRKLGGILLEIAGESAGPCQVVIGVGLNINMPAEADKHVDQPWVDLAAMQAKVSRNQLAGRLLNHLQRAVTDFRVHGLGLFEQEWKNADLLFGKSAVLLQPGQEVHGIGRGIASDGSLLLEVAGQVQRYSYGEISARLSETPV